MTFASAAPLDELSIRILGELQADARLSMAELGRRVALSPPAVAERVRRLEETGVITGYTACVDPARLGYGLIAFIRLALSDSSVRQHGRIDHELQDYPEIVECFHMLGDDCYMMKVVVRDTGHLEQLLGRLVRLGRTTTSIVMSTPVPSRPVLPPDPDGETSTSAHD